MKAVLTAPLKLEGDTELGEGDYRAPNLLQQLLTLFKNVRPGTDLTRFAVPPVFNLPKSALQCYGESVYCINKDVLSACANGKSAIERFVSVVAWHISTTRPVTFGVAPYNPILGETHHVSRGSLNVLLEQVSHHPPVSALHATDEKNGIQMTWCHQIVPQLNGTSIESMVNGKMQLKLLNKGENYVMDHPNLVIKLLPIPSVHWSGKVTIRCQESDLEAELSFGSNSFLGRKANQRVVRGKIFMSSSKKTVYDINGHWDRVVTVKDASNGKVTVIHGAKEVISGLKTPTLKDPEGLLPSESTIVWSKVSKNIMSKCWDKAKEAKTSVEERERALVKERTARGETWLPKHFSASHSKENGWECSPIHKLVPPAPIVVPL